MISKCSMIHQCIKTKLFPEQSTEDQSYKRSYIKYLCTECKWEIQYKIREPAAKTICGESHMNKGHVKCHHRCHE